MPGYTKVEPLMEVRAAGDNVLRDSAQGISLVVVRGADDVLSTVKLPIVLVPSLKKSLFSTSAAAQKGVKTIIEKNGSSLDLGAFSVKLTRLDIMKYSRSNNAKESRRTESSFCAISGEKFGKETVLMALG